MTLNDYFDKILVLHVSRRTDRMEHVLAQCAVHKLDVEIFHGPDLVNDGNTGCTTGHGMILQKIADEQIPRALVLEDDFEFRFPNSQEMFASVIDQVPPDWWMLYLGGHYGNTHNSKVSKNVVRFDYMKTTSSYGVTLEAATEMAPFIKGIGPIDDLYSRWHHTKPCYCLFPRLVVQFESFSDLQMRVMENETCMTDKSHEEAIGMYD